MKIRLTATAATISLFFLLLLMCVYSPLANAIGKWYYWMEPGAYAKYACIEKTPFYDNCFYLTNGSKRGIANFTFAWQVLDVNGLYATVDYNLTFYGVKIYTTVYGPFGPYIDLGNLSFAMTPTVRLDTLELVENGSSWGRWLYWIHGWEVGQWIVGPNITLVRDYLPSPLWPGVSNTTLNVTGWWEPFPSQIPFPMVTSFYNFSKERQLQLGTYSVSQKVDERNQTHVYFAVDLEGFYDSVSLIFLEMWSQHFADDVAYHKLGVWEISYASGRLCLVDSNINFNPSATPEETPTVPAWLVAGIAAVAVLPIVGVALKLKMKRKS